MVYINNNKKGQIIIISALIISIILLSFMTVINLYIYSSHSDLTDNGNINLKNIGEQNIQVKNDSIQAASPEAPLTPSEAKDKYYKYITEYKKNKEEILINESNTFFNYTTKNIKIGWEIGNARFNEIENSDNNKTWIITKDFDKVYKAKFNVNVSPSTSTQLIAERDDGTDMSGNTIWAEQWKMVINDNNIEFESDSGTSSVSISDKSIIDIVEGKVDGNSINTFFSDLESADRLRFSDGGNIEAKYSIRFGKDAVLKNPCGSKCITNNQKTYETGVIRKAYIKYYLENERTRIETDQKVSSNTTRMVIKK